MLVGSLVIIGALASMPFLVASVVADRRIAAATRRAEDMARSIGSASIDAADAQVLMGPGNVPLVDEAVSWPAGARVNLPSPDPWRNAYLVNVGAKGTVWIVSAGPNGVVETPFEGASSARGDDVAARVR
jgi:hypothetical protein